MTVYLGTLHYWPAGNSTIILLGWMLRLHWCHQGNMFKQPDLYHAAIVLVLHILGLLHGDIPSTKIRMTCQAAYRQQKAVKCWSASNLVPRPHRRLVLLPCGLDTKLKCLKYCISICSNIGMNSVMLLLPYVCTLSTIQSTGWRHT